MQGMACLYCQVVGHSFVRADVVMLSLNNAELVFL